MQMGRIVGLCLIIAGFFTTSLAQAQIKPGTEKIVLNLPSEYRWKSTKIPKDTKGIRGTAYTVRGKKADGAPVMQVTVTTIDRRYYPMKVKGPREEKWRSEKPDGPEPGWMGVVKKLLGNVPPFLNALNSTKLPKASAGRVR